MFIAQLFVSAVISLLMGGGSHPAPTPTPTPVIISRPTSTPTPTIAPTATPSATPTPTIRPKATATPVPVVKAAKIYIAPTPTKVYVAPLPTATPVSSGLSNDNHYTNSAGNEIHSPAYSDSVPSGATAKCGDGTYSFSASRRGTCSHHGGVDQWL
jgi:PAB1-binding protein PBP1